MASAHKHASFTLRIPESLKNWMKEKAEQDHRTLNAFIVKTLEDKRAEETQHATTA